MQTKVVCRLFPFLPFLSVKINLNTAVILKILTCNPEILVNHNGSQFFAQGQSQDQTLRFFLRNLIQAPRSYNVFSTLQLHLIYTQERILVRGWKVREENREKSKKGFYLQKILSL